MRERVVYKSVDALRGVSMLALVESMAAMRADSDLLRSRFSGSEPWWVEMRVAAEAWMFAERPDAVPPWRAPVAEVAKVGEGRLAITHAMVRKAARWRAFHEAFVARPVAGWRWREPDPDETAVGIARTASQWWAFRSDDTGTQARRLGLGFDRAGAGGAPTIRVVPSAARLAATWSRRSGFAAPSGEAGR